jgi:hypothetical protein
VESQREEAKMGPSDNRAPVSPREKVLAREGLKHFEKEIRLMSREELLSAFGSKRSGRAVAARIIKNAIWQAWEGIESGRMPLFEGNVRSFWYSHVKIPLDRAGVLGKHKVDHYDTMLKQFVRFTQDLDLFSYTDFGFTDETWENRRIGKRHADVVVISEKAGFFRYLKEVHEQYDVTVASLGGQPSKLATEYLSQHVREALGRAGLGGWLRVKLATIVDWDPAGVIVVESFIEQLEDEKLQVVERQDIIRPEAFTEEEQAAFQYKLSGSKYRTKINRAWLRKTGGVNGVEAGLEADALPRSRLKSRMSEVLSGWLARSPHVLAPPLRP